MKSIYDDLTEIEALNKRDTLKIAVTVELLAYAKIHGTHLGAVDVKMFMSDMPLRDKLTRIREGFKTSKGKEELAKCKKLVISNLRAAPTGYKTYREIRKFFQNQEALTAKYSHK